MHCSPPDSSMHGTLKTRMLDRTLVSEVPMTSTLGFRSQLQVQVITCVSDQSAIQIRGSHDPLLQFSSVQSLSRVQLFAIPWTPLCQASLSITNYQSLLKLMSIESVMPSNHFILCHPLLLPPSIFPTIKVFSNESVLHIRWPKY